MTTLILVRNGDIGMISNGGHDYQFLLRMKEMMRSQETLWHGIQMGVVLHQATNCSATYITIWWQVSRTSAGRQPQWLPRVWFIKVYLGNCKQSTFLVSVCSGVRILALKFSSLVLKFFIATTNLPPYKFAPTETSPITTPNTLCLSNLLL